MYELRHNLDLRLRVRWILWWRVLFLSVMATSAASLDAIFREINSGGIYFAILFGVGISLVSWALTIKRDQSALILGVAWLQVIADIAISSYITYATGGLDSAFILIFGLSIITSAILLFTSGAIVSAVLAAAAFAIVSFFWTPDSFSESNDYVRLVFVSASLLLVGGLVALLFKNREDLIRSLNRTSRDLKGLSELQAAIVDSIPSGIILVSPNKRVLYCNQLAESIVGSSLHSKNLSELNLDFLSEFSETHESPLAPDLSEPKIIRHQKIVLAEGQELIVFEDITNLRKLEGDIRLKEKLASVGQLAAGLAHEIKNPLASLSGSIQLLKNEMELSESDRRLMSIVIRETDRLDDLLQSFLDYAKPSSLQVRKVNLSELVDEVFELVGHERKSAAESDKKQIELVNKVSSSLTAAVDFNQFKQVVWNLIKNAMNAIESKGQVVVRAVEITQEGEDFVRIEIEDNGVGMSTDTQSRIFEPFYTKKMAGTGLGLALVYQIVQAHEGSIGVDSQADEGSLFWVQIKKKGPRSLQKVEAA